MGDENVKTFVSAVWKEVSSDMAKKAYAAIRGRFNALSSDEQGMEAAQVILILMLVIVGLFPIISTIKNNLATKASSANNQIVNTN